MKLKFQYFSQGFLECSHAYSFIYCYCYFHTIMIGVVVTKITWPPKSKIFTFRPSTDKFATPGLDSVRQMQNQRAAMKCHNNQSKRWWQLGPGNQCWWRWWETVRSRMHLEVKPSPFANRRQAECRRKRGQENSKLQHPSPDSKPANLSTTHSGVSQMLYYFFLMCL